MPVMRQVAESHDIWFTVCLSWQASMLAERRQLAVLLDAAACVSLPVVSCLCQWLAVPCKDLAALKEEAGAQICSSVHPSCSCAM